MVNLLPDKDLYYLKKHSLTEEMIKNQLEILQRDKYFPNVVEPATLGNGILNLTDQQKVIFFDYCERIDEKQITKFIPASGAATRMFGFLIQYLKTGKITSDVTQFKKNIQSFPFYERLEKICEDGSSLHEILSVLLEKKGLNYSQMPKGLIPFHQYENNQIRTPIEEHIIESSQFLQNLIQIHYTLPENLSEELKTIFNDKIYQLRKEFNQKIEIQTSHQYSSTDTIALDATGSIVRNENNDILLRPGGHGSLLANLNNIDKEFIILRNIDNIPNQTKFKQRILYQKILLGIAGYLKHKFKEIGQLVTQAKHESATQIINEIDQQLKLNLNADKKFTFLKKPIRVAGFIVNENQPGGGPFWIHYDHRKILAILEKSQFNEKNLPIFEKSTHFNPVDMVVCPFDAENNKINLNQFIDQKQVIITEKNYQGKNIKVFEHPGLWNGSMNDYINVFIELPKENFTPVKTVLDLLNQSHTG